MSRFNGFGSGPMVAALLHWKVGARSGSADPYDSFDPYRGLDHYVNGTQRQWNTVTWCPSDPTFLHRYFEI